MDISELMGALLSSDSILNMSKVTGTTEDDVKAVLASALPDMLSGAEKQAVNGETAEGFVGALADHAKDDTSDVASFMSNIDLEDGSKIIKHLLGDRVQETTETAATRAGLTSGKTGLILAAAAPLLMSLLGKQTNNSVNSYGNNAAGIGGLMGNLLGGLGGANTGLNPNMSNLLTGLLGGGMNQNTNSSLMGNLFGGLTGTNTNSGGLFGNTGGGLFGTQTNNNNANNLLNGFINLLK